MEGALQDIAAVKVRLADLEARAISLENLVSDSPQEALEDAIQKCLSNEAVAVCEYQRMISVLRSQQAQIIITKTEKGEGVEMEWSGVHTEPRNSTLFSRVHNDTTNNIADSLQGIGDMWRLSRIIVEEDDDPEKTVWRAPGFIEA